MRITMLQVLQGLDVVESARFTQKPKGRRLSSFIIILFISYKQHAPICGSPTKPYMQLVSSLAPI